MDTSIIHLYYEFLSNQIDEDWLEVILPHLPNTKWEPEYIDTIILDQYEENKL